METVRQPEDEGIPGKIEQLRDRGVGGEMNAQSPAFPFVYKDGNYHQGLTKGQYAATLILQGMLANPNIYPARRADELTRYAVEMAEDLISKLP